MDANGLDDLVLPGWVLPLDPVQPGREGVAASQSQPKHQIRAAVTLQEGWPGWPSL